MTSKGKWRHLNNVFTKNLEPLLPIGIPYGCLSTGNFFTSQIYQSYSQPNSNTPANPHTNKDGNSKEYSDDSTDPDGNKASYTISTSYS